MGHRSFLKVALALVAAFVFSGCSGTNEYAIVGTARAAGADGTVTVEEIEGGNKLVNIEMAHLPPPERLGDGLKFYTVWFVPEGKQPIMAGKLEYDKDDRTGTMMATSPVEGGFVVRVSAESEPSPASPSDVIVAQRDVK